LTALRAAAEISHANVHGATLGSQKVTFEPSKITPGEYRFDVGTAGSTTLVLQTILPGLMLADAPSTITFEGGTHNPMAPPYDFLSRAFLPLLNRMGVRIEEKLEAYGFHPGGGGKIYLKVEPVKKLRPVILMERGPITARSARILIANLPAHIAEREIKVLESKLQWPLENFEWIELKNNRGPGNVVIVELQSQNVAEVFTGFGEKGLPAERVANQAADEALSYMNAGVAVGCHLADQLLLPLALAGGGGFTTLPLTEHSTTNMQVIQQFLDVTFHTTQDVDRRISVTIK
jgi:RNA 3'-terminal phosphate cyclase (ATP)